MKIIYESNESEFDDFIRSKKPTAQAKELAVELMRDLKPHSRQDIINHIQRRGRELGLAAFRQGCLSGGIQDMASMPECRKLGTGLYQFVADTDNSTNISLTNQACEVCENTIASIQKIARQVDYITASEKETAELNKLKRSISSLEDIIANLKNNS